MLVELAPYGSWQSPISAEMVVEKSVGFQNIQVDTDGNLFWSEKRPQEKGRSTIMVKDQTGKITDLLPAPYNARTTVHEYGGLSYWIFQDRIYFSNFSDQQIYYLQKENIYQLTKSPHARFVNCVFDKKRRCLYAVQENHEKGKVINSIVVIGLDSGTISPLIEGRDFYSSLALSEDGNQLSFLSWDLPKMPWDSTYLNIVKLDKQGQVQQSDIIAGGEAESLDQPRWGPDGYLYFVSDRTGWWNLYRLKEGQIETLTSMKAEFGRPHWVFGASSYAFVGTNNHLLACSYIEEGIEHLALLDPEKKTIEKITLPFHYFVSLTSHGDTLFFIGGSSLDFWSIISYDIQTTGWKVIKKSQKLSIDKDYISEPIPIKFATTDDDHAYAFFYPPHNPHFHALEGEKPPLIVRSHGGPSGQTMATLDLSIQYWTTRGFGVVDVNYRGSTGYGRKYREKLNRRWGIVDVADCAASAKYLVEKGQADPDRLIIKGGSAGGYTTLCALTFLDLFQVGACYYGVSDPTALRRDTHKFESEYLEGLIGPYPKKKSLYEERSPLTHANKLSCPIIFFQGDEDKIVLPSQSEMMVEALKKKGIPVSYLLFEGEQHGFRKSETIIRCLQAELYFYSKIFGIPLREKLPTITIENLK